MILIRDFNNGEPIEILKGHLNTILTLIFKSDKLFSGSVDCMIREWDVKNNYVCSRIFKFNEPIQKISLLNDQNILVFATWGDNKINFLDLQKNKISSSYKALNNKIEDFLVIKN